jgi:hypothetical protein
MELLLLLLLLLASSVDIVSFTNAIFDMYYLNIRCHYNILKALIVTGVEGEARDNVVEALCYKFEGRWFGTRSVQ